MEIENPGLMKNALVNTKLNKKSKLVLSLDLITNAESTIIKVNNKRCPFELAKNIHEISR
jgi:hypothetical protein